MLRGFNRILKGKKIGSIPINIPVIVTDKDDPNFSSQISLKFYFVLFLFCFFKLMQTCVIDRENTICRTWARSAMWAESFF